MISDAELTKLIELGLQEGAPNGALVKILEQCLEQRPLSFGMVTEVDDQALRQFLKDGEIFTEDAFFKHRLLGFNIYDKEGNIIAQINSDGTITGYFPKFTLDADASDEDKEKFKEFCRTLVSKFDAITYPKAE